MFEDPSSSDKIAPSEDLNFTFDATMSSDACESEFVVVTVDDDDPQGDRDTTVVDVDIDCTDPVLVKEVGNPKIPCDGPECDFWITQSTILDFTAYDNSSEDECNLGLDYCQWRFMIDGAWSEENPGGDFDYVPDLWMESLGLPRPDHWNQVAADRGGRFHSHWKYGR